MWWMVLVACSGMSSGDAPGALNEQVAKQTPPLEVAAPAPQPVAAPEPELWATWPLVDVGEWHRCGQVGTNWRAVLAGPGLSRVDLAESFTGFVTPFLATSYLKPSGTFPEEWDEENSPYADWHEFEAASEEWACAYAAGRAYDGKPETAWCEGVAGAGAGEMLVVYLGKMDSAQIRNGYQKSEKLFKANARPKDVRVTVLEAVATRRDATEIGYVYYQEPVRVLGSRTVTLRDTLGEQPLPIDDAGRTPGREILLAIEILSVYPGEKYEDTCVSDVLPVITEG